MQITPKLTDTQTLHVARSILEEHLRLQANGYTCRSRHLYDALLGVTASRQTLETICEDLRGAPKADTVRSYLNEELTMERLPELEKRLNAALVANLPSRLLSKPQRIAIDFHDQPYYGRAEQEKAKWVRARAKKGTTRFLRIATAYLIHRGMRLTLAVHFVLPEDATLEVLKTLLGRIASLGIAIGCLLLDKGFSGIAVMQHLEEEHLSAIIACPVRGKKKPMPSATRALCRGRGSCRTEYTFSNSATSFTAPLAVCRVFTTSKRTGRMQRRASWLIFIVIGRSLAQLCPRSVRQLYRKRFGVETSYRCSKHVRGWTTSQNAAYRFVLIGLSFFMVNVWVHLCWLYTQVPRRGGRYLDKNRLKLTRYAKFIMQALEQRYGRVRAITAPAVPRL